MAIVTSSVTVFLAGCAGLGDRLEQQPLPAGAPGIPEILESLAQNEQGSKGFKATGTVILQSPELESTQISRESTIIYRQPLDLHVIGRKYGTRFVELTCAGTAFLIQFPTERQYYFRPLGERFETVSSADMAKEMFQPESWRDLSPKQIRMLSYDASTRTASMLILDRRNGNRPRRQLVVQGTPWVVMENRLLDSSGREVAVTTKSDYYTRDGVRFPKKVESVFPGEAARMSFTMRKIELNPQLDPKVFDVEAAVRELHKRGFEQVATLRGRGPESGLDDAGDGGYVDNFRDDGKEMEITQ
jgi:hypothetical protein